MHGERVFGAASRIGRVVDVRRFSDDVAAYEAQIIPKEDRVRDVLWHAITSVALFRGLDEAHKQVLTDPFDVVHCEAGDVVVREGDAGDRYYVVEKGEVRGVVAEDRVLVAQLCVLRRDRVESRPVAAPRRRRRVRPSPG